MRGGIHYEVWRLALPSMLAGLTVPLVGMVDIGIVGRVGGVLELAGIGIGVMLFDLLYWNFGFLRSGTGGLTAQLFGCGDMLGCSRVLYRSVLLGLLCSLFVLLSQGLVLWLAGLVLDCEAGVYSCACAYFRVRVWASPATLLLMVFRGWLIGVQDSRSAMVCDLVVNVGNIVLSCILSLCMGLGFVGVAWGTLLAQYVGLLVGVVLVCRKLCMFGDVLPFRVFLRGGAWFVGCGRMFRLHGNLVLRSVSMQVVYVGFTCIASCYGSLELALSGVLMKLFLLYSYLTDGFAYACEALVGRFTGAGDVCSVRKSVRVVFIWSILFSLLWSVLYGVFGSSIVGLLCCDETLVLMSEGYRVWLLLMPLVSCVAFVWDGVYIGLALGSDLRNCMLLSALCFVLVYVLCRVWLGIGALYLGLMCHYVVRSVYLAIRYKSVIINNIKTLNYE